MDKLEVECNDNFERWIYILKNMDRLKEIPYKEVSDMWADFEVVADVGSMDRYERRVYESSLNSYRVLLSAFNKTAEEGHAEGMAKGMAKGLAEGRAEGLAEGRKQEAIKIAQKMRLMGLDNKAIMEMTELTEEDLKTLY